MKRIMTSVSSIRRPPARPPALRADPDHDHLADDLEVGGCDAGGGNPREADTHHGQAGGNHDLVADAHRKLDPDDRADHEGDGDGHDPQPRAERRVALEELEVLGYEEGEAGEGEEGGGERTAGGSEAQ